MAASAAPALAKAAAKLASIRYLGDWSQRTTVR
jgi:hypothetical protein